MATVNQPTANPTNKLTAATIAAAAVSWSGVVVRNLWPEWYDPEAWAAAMPFVVLLVGYFVKDAPNVEVP